MPSAISVLPDGRPIGFTCRSIYSRNVGAWQGDVRNARCISSGTHLHLTICIHASVAAMKIIYPSLCNSGSATRT